jgi:two-component system sensor histidine kinase/response regulator
MRLSTPSLCNERQQLRSQVAALEHLLDVHESTVAKQSDRLEHALLKAEQRADELRVSEQRFKILVEHAPEAIVLLDVDQSRFVDANENALRLFGLSRDQLFKLHPAEVSPKTQPDGSSSVESAQAKIDAVLGGQKKVFDWIHCNSAGLNIPCEVRLVRLPGRSKLLRASITDISARKQTELSLSRARDAAEAASRAKSDFLANLSHGIRTPLNSIIGMTEFVLESGLDDSQQEHLEMVKESADSLLAIANDILDFSKIEASKLELLPIAFDLRTRLQRAVKPLARQAADKSVELRVQVAEDVPDSLTGDFERLKQVILDLVGNGIKFTDEGQVLLNVGLESRSDDKTVLRLTVTDSGVGIPRDKLARVFDAFEQADNSMARRHAGIGLGLAISSRLVELLGGRLEVASELGTGTTFQFTANFQLRYESPAEPLMDLPLSDLSSPVSR